MFDNRCDTIFSGQYCGPFGVRELRSRFSFLYEPERASTNVRVLSAARLDCHPERSEGSQLILARRMNSSVDPLYKKSSIQLSPLDATLTKTERGGGFPQLGNIFRRRPPPK